MKKKEIILWVLVALALAANIWLPKQHRKYSWERDLSQRLAADFCAMQVLADCRGGRHMLSYCLT